MFLTAKLRSSKYARSVYQLRAELSTLYVSISSERLVANITIAICSCHHMEDAHWYAGLGKQTCVLVNTTFTTRLLCLVRARVRIFAWPNTKPLKRSETGETVPFNYRCSVAFVPQVAAKSPGLDFQHVSPSCSRPASELHLLRLAAFRQSKLASP